MLLRKKEGKMINFPQIMTPRTTEDSKKEGRLKEDVSGDRKKKKILKKKVKSFCKRQFLRKGKEKTGFNKSVFWYLSRLI